jgi:hypothetical protein
LVVAVGCHTGPPPTPAETDDETKLISEVIARGPGCEHCTLEFTKLGQLGGPHDTVLLTIETRIAVRDDGKFIAGPTSEGGVAAIFDSIGAIARPYGTAGEGPGENGRILNVLPWPGDSVLLVGWHRLNLVGGDRGQGRTIPLDRVSASSRTVALPRDGIVVRNYNSPPNRAFLAFNMDGSLRSGMGPAWVPGEMEDNYETIGELGPAQQPHAFWSAPQRYRIEMDLWDARDGSRLRQLRDTVPWYTPYDSAALTTFILAGLDAKNPPPPFSRGIRETADSVLWQLYAVPAQDWAPTDSIPARYWGFRRQAYDGVLDLRDPISGQGVMTIRTNLSFMQFVNDSLLAYQRDTDDGFWVYDIYKVVFRR